MKMAILEYYFHENHYLFTRITSERKNKDRHSFAWY